MAGWFIWMVLGAAGSAVGLDLDCAAPERARVLIEYARLSEIEQVEDIHRDALDKALARCQVGTGREACLTEQRGRAGLEWERKLAEIKARYEKMHKDFDEQCRLARRVQMRGAARRLRARRTLCTLSPQTRAATKQMGPYRRPTEAS